jgi:ribonuclease P protein component
MNSFSFKKNSRLTLRNEIEALFSDGKVIHSGSLRVLYRINRQAGDGLKVLITVPRRRFKNASDRNRIKRLIREAYRLNRKNILPDEIVSDFSVSLAVIYTGNSPNIKLPDVTAWVQDALKRLSDIISSYHVKD